MTLCDFWVKGVPTDTERFWVDSRSRFCRRQVGTGIVTIRHGTRNENPVNIEVDADLYYKLDIPQGTSGEFFISLEPPVFVEYYHQPITREYRRRKK